MSVHEQVLAGYLWRLRPVQESDAGFVIELRNPNNPGSQYLNPISAKLQDQKDWIRAQRATEGDYYFVLENIKTGTREGLVSLYNQKQRTAEWGRWILRRGCLGSAESVLLIYRFGFELLGLDEMYSLTLSSNSAVVKLHDSIGALRRKSNEQDLGQAPELDEFVEHFVSKNQFDKTVRPRLEKLTHYIYGKSESPA